jgi:hypothetical protein
MVADVSRHQRSMASSGKAAIAAAFFWLVSATSGFFVTWGSSVDLTHGVCGRSKSVHSPIRLLLRYRVYPHYSSPRSSEDAIKEPATNPAAP